MMKLKFINYFMKVAELTAELSYAKRLKVGSIIVQEESRIISTGYNGTFAGDDNSCEDENGVTKPEILHAEFNAITKLAKSNDSSKDSEMFLTHAPCLACSKLILNAGIKRVYYKNPYITKEGYEYRDGIEYLNNHGVETVIFVNSEIEEGKEMAFIIL